MTLIHENETPEERKVLIQELEYPINLFPILSTMPYKCKITLNHNAVSYRIPV